MTSPLSIVHNRTTTAAHDAMKARERAEADRRRAHSDRQKAIASANPREAHLFTHSLGGVGTHASVVLKIPHKDGSTRSWETCELSVESDDVLKLVVVCPSCIFRHNRSQADSQLTLTSNHRRFALDTRGAGNHWIQRDEAGIAVQVVQLAGAIQTIDRQTCPVCHFVFHIEPSKDPADVVGVSVIREA